MADEWGDGFADTLGPEPAEVAPFTRARLQDEFQHWLNGNYWTEEDREFREHLELEYPWLFADKFQEVDEDGHDWVKHEFNCYVNSIYDTRRRI